MFHVNFNQSNVDLNTLSNLITQILHILFDILPLIRSKFPDYTMKVFANLSTNYFVFMSKP